MRIAVWDTAPAAFLAAGLAGTGLGDGHIVERGSPAQCRRWLLEGSVDVALVPTVTVLRDAEDYSVLPGVAFSSWGYPFARLVLNTALDAGLESVALDPADTQSALLARIVLKEHYGRNVRFVPYEDEAAVREAEEDVLLVTGETAPNYHTGRLTMDLGQEWYELSNYPMVWGLFVTQHGAFDPETNKRYVDDLRAAAAHCETHRLAWAEESTPALHDFFADQMRVRFDDLATASLTELRQYLFYYKVTTDVPDLSLAPLPPDDEGESPDERVLV